MIQSMKKLLGLTLLLGLVWLIGAHRNLQKVDEAESHELPLLVSTLDGAISALNPSTGSVLWTTQGGPIVKVPDSPKRGLTFLPDPRDGSLYLLRDGRLKKFPLNVPQLVRAAPCKSTDGILYAGQKMDFWLAIDMKTGHKIENLDDPTHETCPAWSKSTLLMGRTEYSVTMFDSLNKKRRWNVTFAEYSANWIPTSDSYGLQHYSSSSDGRLVAIDNEKGDLLWQEDLGSPIAAIYLPTKEGGLHKLPFTVLGSETLDNLLSSESGNDSELLRFSIAPAKWDATRHPTVFVGHHLSSLYAFPALVDETTVTIVSKYEGPLLLEGPHPIRTAQPPPANPPNHPHVTVDVQLAAINEKEEEILLQGYHEVPDNLNLELVFQDRSTALLIPIPLQPIGPVDSGRSSFATPPNNTFDEASPVWRLQGYVTGAIWIVLLTTLAIFLLHFSSANGLRWWPFTHSLQSVSIRSQSSSHSRHSNSTDSFSVGKISFDPSAILGRGCEGTVVYRGRFDGREVAVKRVVADFFSLADQEVNLLRESDAHSNVIRYYCMEADSHFRYIALELCRATLYDYVEKPEVREFCQLQPKDINRQAAAGLAHLHSLHIIHRDVKPQNYLLSGPDLSGFVRVLISDFGLGRKLQTGRVSLTRQSGVAGTDGWISPEMLTIDRRITTAADVFSLGCLYYYVWTGGYHPFGDSLRRQANILGGQSDLSRLDGEGSLHSNLISQMIRSAEGERPTLEAVLKHPVFWDADKRLSFYLVVSDRIEKEESDSPVVKILEKGGSSVVEGDWRQKICPALQTDLRKFRSYRGSSVKDLLRAIRNKKNHYRELPEELTMSLGEIPDQFEMYFAQRFPKLLTHVYAAMECCKHERPFRDFYHCV